MRYWYNNYVASVTSGSQNPRWRWDSGRKFILPSIEPQFKKILLKKAQNNTVHIKEYQALAKSLGVPFSNKKIVELEVDLGYIDTSGAFTTITEKMRGRGGGR